MIAVIAAYFVLLLMVSAISYRSGFNNIFSTGKKLPWYLAGFSLFMINPDTINVISKMGIVTEQGYSGLWIFYSGVLGAGFLPVIFAPLWSKLRFLTDNQFILLRFSGTSAKILHLFRAVYVGYLVVALFIAQVYIALSKLLMAFFGLSYQVSFMIIGGITLLIIAKNSLRLKVRTDFLNGMIYLVAFALGAYFVMRQYGGTGVVYSRLNADFHGQTRLLPEGIGQTTFETLPTVFVYFFIQWWSINVLDGGGPEAQRFMNVRNPFGAFKAAILPMVLFSMVFLFHSFVLDAGIIASRDSSDLLTGIRGIADHESLLITLYRNAMPGSLSALVFIAFLAGFTGFLESFINWGSGFVVVDVFKTYLIKNRSERDYTILSYVVMLFIGGSGILLAWYNTHLLGFQKFIFSMAAGVGPVFILRWFWWRINAWSQFTAMVSSLLLAVGWDFLYARTLLFKAFIDLHTASLNLSPYSFKLISLTIGVSVSWLIVTLLTRPDDPAVLRAFAETVRPGGWWKNYSAGKANRNPHRWVLVVLYPALPLLPFLSIWHFKFGSLATGTGMLTMWLLLMVYIVRHMARA